MIDCHTHVVSPDHARYPLQPRDLSGQWYREAPASAEDLAEAMDASGVARAVLVQGVGAYTWKNDYAADAARANAERFVSACAIDAEAADAPDTLAYWLDERGMQGVRLFALSREGESWLATSKTIPLFEIARSRHAHVIVTLLPHQLPELERLLEREPQMPISLDHCAFALGDAEAREALFTLARFDALHLKISTHNLDEAEQGRGVGPLVRELIDRFGAERLMWGSDFCQTYDRPYAELVDLGRRAFESLPGDQAEACLSGTARRLWPGRASPATR